MISIRYNLEVLKATLEFLKQSGLQNKECVVLWLGKRSGNVIDVTNVYRPAHKADSDYFHIPRHSMNDLKQHIRQNRLVIGAQVHSHPKEAFHSKANDDWAIVRHEGALSIVIPNFARHTKPCNFMNHAAIYSLHPNNQWIKINGQEAQKSCIQMN